MLDDQHHLCAICDSYLEDPYVDHDHTTLKVRGLLCLTCNAGIGMLQDNPDLLERAVQYLRHECHVKETAQQRAAGLFKRGTA
jgi:hypothetical protein